jgi:hypothetical protein
MSATPASWGKVPDVAFNFSPANHRHYLPANACQHIAEPLSPVVSKISRSD